MDGDLPSILKVENGARIDFLETRPVNRSFRLQVIVPHIFCENNCGVEEREQQVLFNVVQTCFTIVCVIRRSQKLCSSIASKLLADALENFLRTCLEVTNYFAPAASKTLFFSYRTGNTFERSILDDITPFSTHSCINLRVTVCLRELLQYVFGLKVLETLPGTSIPRRIHARKVE